MNVLVVDDQPEVRSALRLLLEEEGAVTQVTEADSVQALSLLAELLCPAILLVDWELPQWRPAQLLPPLRQRQPGLRVIALSLRPELEQAALAAGADAFVSKGDPPERLRAALARLVAG